jgi:KDO2-lipid IV(A) lauroyltransferase
MINKWLSRLGFLFLYLVSLLPFWLLYRFSDFLFFILYYIIGYRRKVVQENLRNAFPDKTEAERKFIEKKYFSYLADLIVEVIKLFTISEKELKKRMLAPNGEMLEEYFKQGKSIIGAVGHYGNWEMAGLRLGMYTEKRRMVVYKPLTNAYFDNAFKNMRSRTGATLVDMKHTVRKMVEYRNELMISVLVSDQTPVRSDISYFTEFLSQPTPVFVGIEKLAKMIDCVVVFCDIRRIKRGYYQCTLVPLFEHPKDTAEHEITNTHVHYLEQVIKEEPQYWLWSHRRWKFKPGDIHE